MEKSTEKMTFEEAFAELEKITGAIETGSAELEQSISLYERACELKNHCNKKLSNARLKLEKISKSSEGVKIEKAEDF